jgi:hypothetical protein
MCSDHSVTSSRDGTGRAGRSPIFAGTSYHESCHSTPQCSLGQRPAPARKTGAAHSHPRARRTARASGRRPARAPRSPPSRAGTAHAGLSVVRTVRARDQTAACSPATARRCRAELVRHCERATERRGPGRDASAPVGEPLRASAARTASCDAASRATAVPVATPNRGCGRCRCRGRCNNSAKLAISRPRWIAF